MDTKNIMIVGVGGQGTLLTSRILGGVMLDGGFEVKMSEVHGMAQRGGSVVTFVRYGTEVAEPIVPEKIIENLSKEYKVISVDALSEARKLGNTKVFNVVILGVAAKHMDFTPDQCNAVIERIVKPKFIDINKKAFETGYNL